MSEVEMELTTTTQLMSAAGHDSPAGLRTHVIISVS